MTTATTATAAIAATPPTTSAAHGRLTFGGLLHSEWIKLTTLRSTVWCYLIMAAVTLGLGFLLSFSLAPDPSAATSAEGTQSTWVQIAVLGINFSQLVSVVLGALMITGEYGTGMIRSTMTAAPQRVPALLAKAIVFGVVTFVVVFASIVTTALVTAPVLAGQGLGPDLADGQAWLSMVGGAGYVTLIGVMALSIGAIIRNGAGGIAAGLGLVLVVPTVLQVIAGITQAVWPLNAAAFLPSSASLMSAYRPTLAAAPAQADLVVLDPAQAALVLAGWVVATFVIAALLLRRRDV